MKELELYIHIPFCVRKCKYCDFLSAPSTETERRKYVESLCADIRSYAGFAGAYHVTSIFVGGGTPSILTGEQIKNIFEAVNETFKVDVQAEITLEVNPGTAAEEKLRDMLEAGVNRLSIGLQSADDRELKALGRIHTYEDFLETWRTARKTGFKNINVDLMSAIPFQTVESYERTLRNIAALGPEHISAYSLIIEEGTPFYERYGEGRNAGELPSEDEERRMYRRTKGILEDFGYRRYEISNYALPGYECRHNLGYWERREYLGIGTGASSFINNCRWRQGEEDEKEALDVPDQMEEFMFLGLRKIEGVSIVEFAADFGLDMMEVYGDVIEKLRSQDLLEIRGDRIALTERGIDVSNYVMSEFLF